MEGCVLLQESVLVQKAIKDLNVREESVDKSVSMEESVFKRIPVSAGEDTTELDVKYQNANQFVKIGANVWMKIDVVVVVHFMVPNVKTFVLLIVGLFQAILLEDARRRKNERSLSDLAQSLFILSILYINLC
jgi:hypothetical protein